MYVGVLFSLPASSASKVASSSAFFQLLRLNTMGVCAIITEEFIMCTSFQELSFAKDIVSVCLFDCGETADTSGGL